MRILASSPHHSGCNGLRRRLLLPVALLVCIPAASRAQVEVPSFSRGAPPAPWIAHAGVPGDAYGVFHFRRSFTLSAVPGRFTVHVSADNRYRLFVNGEPVVSGPQRSDVMHWRYETIDLAPWLRPGRNVLAAVVWNWGPWRPVAQHSHRTAFIVQGDTETEAIASTDKAWKVMHDTAYAPLPVTRAQVGGYYASAPGESVDAHRYPWGWERPDFDDASWSDFGTETPWTAQARTRGTQPTGEAGGWQLVPRTLPFMEETETRLAAVRRAEGVEANDAFLRGAGDLTVPARTRAVLLLDQAHLTNAYVVLETTGGDGSTITLTYAEALRDAQGQKGNRNEIEGKSISGLKDVFLPDGGERRRFQTLWFRTYRYLQLEIETADAPLRVHDLHGVYTAYPYEMRARFTSDVPWLSDMWAMNWRVSRLCAWETFFDTPYYEQLQYVGDTRIQSLISLYMSGDDRLVRQAITHFDLSRIPEGITASRYPSDLPQYIPTFSLIWIAMVHDYWMHRDDVEFVRGMIPGMRGVLAWFERHVDETGLLGPVPWWPFVDWAAGWPVGVPPGGRDGHSVMITLQYVYALQRAADIETALGQPAEAARYLDLAETLLTNVREKARDPARGLFRDALETNRFSQQTNTMALLTGAVPEADRAAFMQRVLSDPSLTQATYYFSWYVLEALREAGLAELYLEQLAPWQGMLALGLTTTPEQPEPTRSDSHAWAAHPNYGLLATVLGVRPAEPGFRSVRIAPSPGPLRQVEGTIPHPSGDIDVRLVRVGERGIRAVVVLPPGLEGVFEWNGRQARLIAGRQELVF